MLRFSYAGTAEAKNLMNTQVFDEGNYKVCYKINNANDNMLLGDYCTDFSITQKKSALTQLDTNSKKRPVTIHGTSELLFNYSTNQSNFTNLPPTYLNWTLSPQITLWDIPVSGRLFLTTMNSSVQQNMNSFSFNFDANMYREVLKKKLLKLLEKNKTLSKIGAIDFSSYLSEYENIKSTISNPSVLNELKQLGELDSLQQLAGQIKELSSEVKNTANEVKNTYTGIKDKYEESKDLLTNKNDKDSADHLNLASDSMSLDSSLHKGELKIEKYKDSLNVWKDSLVNIKDQLMDKADSLKNKLNDANSQAQSYMNDPTKLGQIGLDSLKGRIKELEWLESKRDYYNKLMARKAEIEKYAKQFGLMDSSGNLKIDQIKDVDPSKLGDSKYLFDKLRNHKLLRKFDKILYSVKSISIGMGTPNFSSLSLNGMAVNGFTMEVEPFNIYGGFTYGEILNPVLTNNFNYMSYRRNLVGGKLGYGSKDKSHIHLSIISATDDSSSVNPRDSLYLKGKLPQDNKVINMDAQLNLFKDKFILTAEISGSQTVKDLTNFTGNNIINATATGNSNDWFVNIFTQNQQVHKAVVDYAINAKLETKLFKDKTNLSASFKRVGPNYYSFGLPFLMRDLMTFEVKYSQKLWKNRIQLSAFIRRNNDNLTNNKTLTTVFYTYGFDFNLKIPKFPSVRASMNPIMIQNDSVSFQMMSLNTTVNYSFNLKKIQSVVSFTYLKQFTLLYDTTYYFDIDNASLLYTIHVKKGPTVQFNSGFFANQNKLGRKDTWIAGVGTSVSLFKIWNNTIGGNIYINKNELKWGAYYQSNLNITKYLNFSIRLETNQFNTYQYIPGVVDFSQFTCRTLLTAKW
jgi:hypothetical protein